MSFWAKIEDVNITNINAFANACRELGLLFDTELGENKGYKTTHKILDLIGRDVCYEYRAYLTKNDRGGYSIVGDADPKYSSIAKRFGKEFGIIKQHYLKHDIIDRARKSGASVIETKSKGGKNIILRLETK